MYEKNKLCNADNRDLPSFKPRNTSHHVIIKHYRVAFCVWTSMKLSKIGLVCNTIDPFYFLLLLFMKKMFNLYNLWSKCSSQNVKPAPPLKQLFFVDDMKLSYFSVPPLQLNYIKTIHNPINSLFFNPISLINTLDHQSKISFEHF